MAKMKTKKGALTGNMYRKSLIIELLRLRDGMREHFRPALSANKMTDQYWRILKTVAENDVAEISFIGRRAVLAPASLSRILKKMEAAQLLRRVSDPADARRSIMVLTAKGRSAHDKLSPMIKEIYGDLAESIGADLLLELEDVVGRVNQRLVELRDGTHTAK